MTDDVKITSPVKIVADSPQRVAFDLMQHIGYATYEELRAKHSLCSTILQIEN